MSKIYESLSKEEIFRELSRCNLGHVNDTDIAQDYSAHSCISTMKLIELLGKELEQERAKVKKMRNCENCLHFDVFDECTLLSISCIKFDKWKLKEGEK